MVVGIDVDTAAAATVVAVVVDGIVDADVLFDVVVAVMLLCDIEVHHYPIHMVVFVKRFVE